jgi:agmatine deiminase
MSDRRPVTTRRSTILAAAGLAAGWAWGAPPVQATRSSTWRIPGEFEPQRAIWLGYDVNLEPTTLALVRALSPYVRLNLLVSDDQAQNRARQLLEQESRAPADVSYFVDPLAMYYPRDGAVFASLSGQALGMVDFQWNQYGLPDWCRRRHPRAPREEQQCAQKADRSRDDLDRAIARLTTATTLPSALVMEGGGVESNGQGLLIVCEAMVKTRNPSLTRSQAQRHLLSLPGVQRIIWLPEGLAHDPHLRATIVGPYVAWGTGGHTDEFVRFADERTVLLAWPDDEEARRHPVARLNQQRMRRNATILSAAKTLSGEPLRLVRIPMPRVVEQARTLSDQAHQDRFDEWAPALFPAVERRQSGDTVIQVATASYLNFVISNGVVVLPDYRSHGTPRSVQDRVRVLFEQVFPGRDIRWIDAINLNWLGGGLHCATLHQPFTQ